VQCATGFAHFLSCVWPGYAHGFSSKYLVFTFSIDTGTTTSGDERLSDWYLFLIFFESYTGTFSFVKEPMKNETYRPMSHVFDIYETAILHICMHVRIYVTTFFHICRTFHIYRRDLSSIYGAFPSYMCVRIPYIVKTLCMIVAYMFAPSFHIWLIYDLHICCLSFINAPR